MDERTRRIDEFDRSLVALTPRTFVTPTIVGINVAIFLVMVACGMHFVQPDVHGLLRWGANYGPKTINGQWWRLLTCTFLHIGVLHLGFNMLVLWDAGRLAERLLGNAGFLLVYLLCGLAGSLASLWWHPGIVSAGASGAIFGVYGALLGFLALRRDTIPFEVLKGLRSSAFVFLIYNVFFGLTVPGIDMAAHLGGLAAGFVCGLAMSQPLAGEAISGRRKRSALVAAGGGSLVVLLAFALPKPSADILNLLDRFGLGGEYLALGEYDRAIARFSDDIRRDPRQPTAYVGRGDAYLARGACDKAIADFSEAIRLDRNEAGAYSDRSLAYSRKAEYEKAIADASEAIRLDPKRARAYSIRAAAYILVGEHKKAIADCDEAIKLEPKLSSAYLNRGLAYRGMGQHDLAIQDFTEGIRLEPRSFLLYVARAQAYREAGDITNAWSDERKAQELMK
jgi:rhomboid protease GluP